MAVVVIALALGLVRPTTILAATAPDLGTADSFAILAGTPNITNVPTSSIAGDVGLSPATGAGIGLTAAQVTGKIYAVDAAGPAGSVANPGLLTTAKADLVGAYDALSAGDNATCDITYAGTKDLVGLSLVPGVYCADAFELSGTLTLSGTGVWIFRSAATLVTSGTANVVGGNPCNVWWKVVSSVTLGTNTALRGNILALTSIALQTGATLDGRALARNGAVTLDHNTITSTTCSSSDNNDDSENSNSDIKVKKTASDYKLNSGPKKVTFTYKVTNEGDIALSDISVKDDKCDDVSYVSGDKNDDELLDTTEEWKYECTKKVKKTETNTVTAKGTANGERIKDTDKATVTVSTPSLPNAGANPDEVDNSSLWMQIISWFSF
jgi:hypothetical protein